MLGQHRFLHVQIKIKKDSYDILYDSHVNKQNKGINETIQNIQFN